MSQPDLPRGLLQPKHPERICWGCDKYCAAGDLRCGSGFIRTPHPIELFGETWLEDEREAGAGGDGEVPCPDRETEPAT